MAVYINLILGVRNLLVQLSKYTVEVCLYDVLQHHVLFLLPMVEWPPSLQVGNKDKDYFYIWHRDVCVISPLINDRKSTLLVISRVKISGVIWNVNRNVRSLPVNIWRAFHMYVDDLSDNTYKYE